MAEHEATTKMMTRQLSSGSTPRTCVRHMKNIPLLPTLLLAAVSVYIYISIVVSPNNTHNVYTGNDTNDSNVYPSTYQNDDIKHDTQTSLPNMPIHSHHRRLTDGYDTGSFSNCTTSMATSTQPHQRKPISKNPESSMAVISCRDIHFRAPLSDIEKGGVDIVVGVLSGAGGKGPIHRDSIRSTWARDRKGVYFIVAGPWEAIEEEYQHYRDLIWIDEEEVYEGEESVLPFKTEIFLYIINKYSLPGKAGFQYLFKTDDDSYVDMTKLENAIVGKKDIHYWGCCTDVHYRPLRHPSRKWRITFDLYPEEYYPLYCQGAGFAVSRDMANCIIDGDNLKNFRYNPFEDVSVGLLAERCGYRPSSDCHGIQQYRTKDSNEIKQLNKQEVEEINFLPRATMKHKILQHRVKTHIDMYAHYKCTKEDC